MRYLKNREFQNGEPLPVFTSENFCLSKILFLNQITLLTCCWLTQFILNCSSRCFFLVPLNLLASCCPVPTLLKHVAPIKLKMISFCTWCSLWTDFVLDNHSVRPSDDLMTFTGFNKRCARCWVWHSEGRIEQSRQSFSRSAELFGVTLTNLSCLHTLLTRNKLHDWAVPNLHFAWCWDRLLWHSEKWHCTTCARLQMESLQYYKSAESHVDIFKTTD